MSEEQGKIRADVALASRGICESRSRAQSIISSGLALANGKVIEKSSQMVKADDILEISPDATAYISRGEMKLEKAIAEFHAGLTGKICIDVGASTGGFTSVCLKHGAEHVYAVDVGTAQLAGSLRQDCRVTVMENTNARYLTREQFPHTPQIAVMDVSFISIKLILPTLFSILGENGIVYTLIKPQFEAGKQRLGKNGIVKDSRVHLAVLREIAAFAAEYGFGMKQLTYSPIAGGDGNIEFLAEICQQGCDVTDSFMESTVRDAWKALK